MTRDKVEVPMGEEEDSQMALSYHHSNLNKILYRRQEESKKIQMPMKTIPGVNMKTNTSDLSGWTITEVTNENGLNTVSPIESIEKRR